MNAQIRQRHPDTGEIEIYHIETFPTKTIVTPKRLEHDELLYQIKKAYTQARRTLAHELCPGCTTTKEYKHAEEMAVAEFMAGIA